MSLEKLDHIVSGALYDFAAHLTTRPERITLSASDNAAPAAEAVKEFLPLRGIDQTCEPFFQYPLSCGAQPKPAPVLLTDEEVWNNDEIMLVNADLDLVREDLMRLVKAITSATYQNQGLVATSQSAALMSDEELFDIYKKHFELGPEKCLRAIESAVLRKNNLGG